MAYVEANLNPGETVIFRGRLHKIVFVPALAVLLAALALLSTHGSTPVARLEHGLGFCLVLLGGLGLVRALVEYLTTEYAVTDRRVIVKWGWLARQVRETLLGRVESMRLSQGLIGRILNYGTVVVSGTGGQHNVFSTIADPTRFLGELKRQLERGAANAPDPPPAAEAT